MRLSKRKKGEGIRVINPSTVKCKFCSWSTYALYLNGQGDPVFGYSELVRHCIGKHSYNLSKVQDYLVGSQLNRKSPERLILTPDLAI